MEKFKLKALKRTSTNPRLLRREGYIPATLYGDKIESTSWQVCAKEFSKIPHAVLGHVMELELEDSKPVNILIRSIERKIIKNEIQNIQFYQVDMNKVVSVSVPLKFIGNSPAVKAGAQLFELFQEAQIECLPGQIPDCLEVDLGMLEKVDDSIHFKNLTIANYIKILNPPDEVVVKAVTSKAKVAETATAAQG